MYMYMHTKTDYIFLKLCMCNSSIYLEAIKTNSLGTIVLHYCSFHSLTGMAEQILAENRKYLDDLAEHEKFDSNPTVNKTFKKIDILARDRKTTKPIQECSQHPEMESEN